MRDVPIGGALRVRRAPAVATRSSRAKLTTTRQLLTEDPQRVGLQVSNGGPMPVLIASTRVDLDENRGLLLAPDSRPWAPSGLSDEVWAAPIPTALIVTENAQPIRTDTGQLLAWSLESFSADVTLVEQLAQLHS